MRQRQDKVCLWTKTASNEAVQVAVGKQFKEFLEYDQNCGFLAHVRICPTSEACVYAVTATHDCMVVTTSCSQCREQRAVRSHSR